MTVSFHLVDTLSGRLVRQLNPVKWTLSDPVQGVGTGELTIPRPEPRLRDAMHEATRPRKRWVAARDDATGVWIWGGYIPRRPKQNGSTVTIRLEQWRGWFYRTPLRPLADDASGDYIVRNTEQTTIFRDLVLRALDDTAADSPLSPPPIKVDTPPVTGVRRRRTLRQLDQSIGDSLDGLVKIERGIEWWTYVATSLADPTVLEVHATCAYPERTFRTAGPIVLRWQIGKGGNVAEEPVWPEAGEEFTRVWATGDGEPPDQVWAYDESLVEDDVLWESKIGPLDGVKDPATAYEHAYGARLDSAQYAQAAEFVVTSDQLPFGDVAAGDRARVIYDDGWESVDVPAARIVERVMSGGRGVPEVQRLIVDLSDVQEPESETPGVDGVPDG